MTKKIDRRVRYTKMVLRESLAELLAEKPIEKITVKEICENADINRGTFYSHYSDQFDLYNSIVDELLEGMFDRLGDFMSHNDSEAMSSIIDVFDYIKENANLVKILLNGGVSFRIEKRIRDIIKGIYLDKTQKTIDIDYVNCAYSFIAAGSISLIRHWLNSDMDKSTEEMAYFIRKLIANGFASLF